MKQFNKQLEIDLSLFEKETKNQYGQISTERFIILFLIVLGCTGLFYSLPTKTGSISAITTNTNFNQLNESQAGFFVPQEAGEETITVSGPMITGKRITFGIPTDMKGKAVSIDFGDGRVQMLRYNKSVNHVYEKAGKYQVEVMIRMHDNSMKRVIERIQIN